MRRIGVLSDTHSFLDPRLLVHFKDVDEIWHAGDIGNLEVTDQLEAFKPLRAVYGNIDGTEARASYPLDNKFTVEGISVWITHIAGPVYAYDKRIREALKIERPKILVCGHSHILKIQMDKRINTLYMNPGAAGKHGFHKVRTALRFSIDGNRIFDMEVIELGPRSEKFQD